MEEKKQSGAKRTAIKISAIAVISLLLLIPLAMTMSIIDEREETKSNVEKDIANSYGSFQTVYEPYIKTYRLKADVSKDAVEKDKIETYKIFSSLLDYKSEITTDILHRSIYDVTVYKSNIHISGQFPITENIIKAQKTEFGIRVTDLKGISNLTKLKFGDKEFALERKDKDQFIAVVDLPQGVEPGGVIDFSVSFDLKGTKSLYFEPSYNGETSLVMSSSYPHPSFKGEFLPNHREVNNDGFEATWNVSDYNVTDHYSNIGVEFVEPANPYQQSMRSLKYGMLIIVLVFVAGLFVEFITKREINLVQYAIIGLSLVLFYSLLVSFSEFMMFGLAYLIASGMTVGALTFYFRAILKAKSGYVLGSFVGLVYILNYMLLQMETFALLSGSLILFILLCIVMYITANSCKFIETKE